MATPKPSPDEQFVQPQPDLEIVAPATVELNVPVAEVRQIWVGVQHPHRGPIGVDQVQTASGVDQFGQVVDDPLLVRPVVGQNVPQLLEGRSRLGPETVRQVMSPQNGAHVTAPRSGLFSCSIVILASAVRFMAPVLDRMRSMCFSTVRSTNKFERRSPCWLVPQPAKQARRLHVR